MFRRSFVWILSGVPYNTRHCALFYLWTLEIQRCKFLTSASLLCNCVLLGVLCIHLGSRTFGLGSLELAWTEVTVWEGEGSDTAADLMPGGQSNQNWPGWIRSGLCTSFHGHSDTALTGINIWTLPPRLILEFSMLNWHEKYWLKKQNETVVKIDK